jgi:PAS domain S-box-containing protein
VKLRPAVFALVPLVLAFVVAWIDPGLIGAYHWFLFYPAAFLSSWMGGRRVGVLGTLATAAIAWWFVIPPEGQLRKDIHELLPALVFVAMGVFFAVFHDRLKRAIAEVEAANVKLKEHDDLKTRFFANVSHELRTPLSLILGPTRELLKTRELAPAERRDLEIIERNAQTLLGRVNDLLDVAKLDAGAARLEYAETDVARLLRFVASHFEVVSIEAGVALAIEAPAHFMCQVDPDKVRRVVFNLVSNALKFTPREGRVRLSVRGVGSDRFVLEVADTGPGIPREQRVEVFERFRQLDGGTTRRFGGTGLGLSIAREIATLHDGRIAVDDAPEGGALFTVELPRNAPPGTKVRGAANAKDIPDERPSQRESLMPIRAVSAPPSDEIAPLADAPVVLVVEDNEEMNRHVASALSDRYRVERASDGRAGIAAALRLLPDIVLTDLMMPVVSGETLVRELRSRTELDEVPIVVLTAKADEATRVRVLEEGATDYLLKPFTIEELRARVANLVSHKLANERVRKSEATLDGVISISADAIIMCDDEQRITRFNAGATKVFGYASPEAIGQPLEMLLPTRFRDVHDKHFRSFAADPSESRLMNAPRPLVWGLRKTGEEFPAEISLSKLTVGGERVFTVSLRDVTERERVRLALEQALQARDEVLGIVAHDLRNPLNTIVLYTNLLKRDRGIDQTEDSPVAAIARAATRMNRLIQDLLDVSRLEAGRALRIAPESLAPASLVHDVIDAHKPSAQAASIEITTDVKTCGTVIADHDRLLQVFDNLVYNAIKFTPAHGHITLSAEPRDGEIVFCVCDTGRGLTTEACAHLFDRFWQASESDRRGQGLGMSVAKAIVEGHGGRIWVDSKPGEGTRVSFAIPAANRRNIQS